jgi:parvulin-like peptidyl-prolyl isomerase
VLIRVNGEPVTEADVVLLLKLQEDYRRAFLEILQRVAVRQHAERLGVSVEDGELQAQADESRRRLGLYSADALDEHLHKRGVTIDQWADSLEFELLERKLRDRVIPADRIEAYFGENPGQFTTVALYRIVVEDREAAEEVRRKVEADGEDFTEVARRYSQDAATAEAGGYMGLVKVGTLAPEVERLVFGSKPGAVLGPVKEAAGHTVYRVVSIHTPELTPEVREEIAGTLYRQWREGLLRSARLEAPEEG